MCEVDWSPPVLQISTSPRFFHPLPAPSTLSHPLPPPPSSLLLYQCIHMESAHHTHRGKCERRSTPSPASTHPTKTPPRSILPSSDLHTVHTVHTDIHIQSRRRGLSLRKWRGKNAYLPYRPQEKGLPCISPLYAEPRGSPSPAEGKGENMAGQRTRGRGCGKGIYTMKYVHVGTVTGTPFHRELGGPDTRPRVAQVGWRRGHGEPVARKCTH